MKLSRYEQETIVNYNAGEQSTILCSRDKAGQDEISKTYSFPKSYVSCRKPRAVSIEQRERARQMMIGQNRAIGRKDYPEN